MDKTNKEEEFERAVDEFGGIIARICFYFSSDSEEFKDLRQDTLYNLWKGWNGFRRDSKFSTWIYRVCFNTCVSHNRKSGRKGGTVSIDEAIDLPAETDSNILRKYHDMQQLIKKLPYTDRAMILMWLDDKPYDEIAELMGLSRNNVAVKLRRIKEKLVKMSNSDLQLYE